ncbi:hypothetical protein Hdeb2414_s0397g00885801 [Helianthus debilis subsp. tardiflorus]
MGYGIITASFLLVSALAVTLQVFFSPISPDPLELPPEHSPHLFTPNNHLQGVIKLGEGILNKPEGLCVDQQGVLYTATRDVWIKRLHTNGTCENWKKIDRDTLLGLTVTRAGDLVVCDADQVNLLYNFNVLSGRKTSKMKTFTIMHGLIKVSKDGAVTALAMNI